MVSIVMDDPVKQRYQFSMTLTTEPALKNRELQPLAIALHDIEDATPAFGIADVVCHDIQMFLSHASARREVGKLGKFPEQMASQQSSLQLEQTAVTHPISEQRMSDFVVEATLER